MAGPRAHRDRPACLGFRLRILLRRGLHVGGHRYAFMTPWEREAQAQRARDNSGAMSDFGSKASRINTQSSSPTLFLPGGAKSRCPTLGRSAPIRMYWALVGSNQRARTPDAITSMSMVTGPACDGGIYATISVPSFAADAVMGSGA